MLNKNDTIGIIALAGACEKEKIEQAVINIENLGYKVKLSENIFDKDRYLAGSDKDKLKELYNFFQDPQIKLILNARGGYGSIRLINKINYDIVKANPKPFCGFSDITALLLMFYKKCGLITYHGPMACSDFGISPPPSIALPLEEGTLTNFFKAINNKHLQFSGTKIYKQGSTKGILWGGNLSTIASLCGQDFIPEEDFIFFTEDLNEPVYKIDKMFTQLFNIKNFNKHCKAIVLGDFLNVDNEAWLEELFSSFVMPTIGGFKITHAEEKITLPVGRFAKLENGILSW
ncbi:LD-carboxypeptidase [bacterium]|nr:LD-carboxypeptidase [bacterium]